MTTTPNSSPSTIEEALRFLSAQIREGLRHGHFEFTVIGEVHSGHKRQLTLKTGKSHRFFIPIEELDQQ